MIKLLSMQNKKKLDKQKLNKKKLNKQKFKLSNIDQLQNIDFNKSTIYLTRLYDYKLKNSELLSKSFENTILKLEKENHNCHLLPTSLDYKIYENKKEVYKFFDYTNIKYPKTFIINNLDNLDEIIDEINYPVITKHPYSCSSFGMNNFDNYNDKIDLKNKLTSELNNHKEIIIQKKIMFTKECRLTCINGKIFHGYYRHKKNKFTMSAATCEGGKIDFNIDLQDKKLQKIARVFYEKTNMKIYGLDVAWENNNFDDEPYILEVSPIFDLNPEKITDNYKSFKNTNEYISLRYNNFKKYYNLIDNYSTEFFKKPIIFCDIDNTISKSEIRIKNNRYFKDNKYKINNNSFTTEEVLKDQIIEDSVESNHKLLQNYRLYFVTARGNYQNPYDTTRDWLYKNNFNYDKLFVVDRSIDKIKLIKSIINSNNVPYILIDDFTHKHENDVCELNKNIIKQFEKNNINTYIFKNDWPYIIDNIENLLN